MGSFVWESVFVCLGSDLLLLLSENIQALEQYREFYRVRWWRYLEEMQEFGSEDLMWFFSTFSCNVCNERCGINGFVWKICFFRWKKRWSEDGLRNSTKPGGGLASNGRLENAPCPNRKYMFKRSSENSLPEFSRQDVTARWSETEWHSWYGRKLVQTPLGWSNIN